MSNFVNLKDGEITVNSYRFVDAEVTDIEDLMESKRQDKGETLVATVENKLTIFKTEKNLWSAGFTGIDGMDNFCYEEEGHNICAETEKEAIQKAESVWGLTNENYTLQK